MSDFDPLSGHNQVMVDTFMSMTRPAHLKQPELRGRAGQSEWDREMLRSCLLATGRSRTFRLTSAPVPRS